MRTRTICFVLCRRRMVENRCSWRAEEDARQTNGARPKNSPRPKLYRRHQGGVHSDDIRAEHEATPEVL